jgi:diguanylate cyclase (GGDEF)-like protein
MAGRFAFKAETINVPVPFSASHRERQFLLVEWRLGSRISRMENPFTDPLTGLFNYTFFREILARETASSDRYSLLSLLMIDIDRFKLIDDILGHVVGNKVLVEVAKILQQSVRNTDFVFRYGGDEFAVLLTGTNLEGAGYAAEKLLFKVETAEILRSLGRSGTVTVSIDYSEYQRGHHFDTLIKEVNGALQVCKDAGGNHAFPYKRGRGPNDDWTSGVWAPVS